MIQFLREYIEGDKQVTEYTKDGETVSHVVEVSIQSEILPGETLPVPPTFEQRINELQTKNVELESALVEMSTYVAMQEQRNKQNEQAILELTTMIAGGNV